MKIPKNPYVKKAWVLLVVLVAGYFLINLLILEPIAVGNERQRFETASAELKKLSTEIESLVGPADEVKQINFCQRPNLKNKRGPLSCVVGMYLLYKDKNDKESTLIMQETAEKIGSPLKYSLGDKDTMEFGENKEAEYREIFSQSYSTNSELSCSVSYTHPIDSSLSGMFRENTPKESLQIDLTCSGPSRTEHYPMRN
jgi:hypothetical protein